MNQTHQTKNVRSVAYQSPSLIALGSLTAMTAGGTMGPYCDVFVGQLYPVNDTVMNGNCWKDMP
ncbi:MAG: hypothetical protein IT523_01180 [Burkholderiales bacterium]|nr:hypothetical protein [Burkholderiales bacterium]